MPAAPGVQPIELEVRTLNLALHHRLTVHCCSVPVPCFTPVPVERFLLARHHHAITVIFCPST